MQKINRRIVIVEVFIKILQNILSISIFIYRKLYVLMNYENDIRKGKR